MATAFDDFEDVITCDICLDVTEDPRALPCQHIYCFKCIRSIHESRPSKQPADTFSCPKCRRDVPIPHGDVGKFPRSFQSARIKDIIHQHKRNISKSLCSFGDQQKAVIFCFTCTRTLCVTCHKIHDDEQKDHVTVAVDDDVIKSLVCSKHKLFYEVYCTECCAPVCRLCRRELHSSDKHHREHAFCEDKKDSRDTVVSIQKKWCSLERSLDEADRVEREFDDHIDQVLVKMADHKSKLIEQIKADEQILRSELEQHRLDVKERLHNTRKIILQRKIELNIAQGNIQNVVNPIPKIPGISISNLGSFLDDIRYMVEKPDLSISKAPRYKFTPNTDPLVFGNIERNDEYMKDPKDTTTVQKLPQYNIEGKSEDSIKQTKEQRRSGDWFLSYLFGRSRPPRGTAVLLWKTQTVHEIENVCCCSNGDIITANRDPYGLSLYTYKGEAKKTPLAFGSLNQPRRAAVYSHTSALAVIDRKKADSLLSSPASVKTDNRTLVLFSFADQFDWWQMNSYPVDGNTSAVTFTREDNILIGINGNTSKLVKYGTDGTKIWEKDIQHTCQRIAVDQDSRIIVLGNKHVYVYKPSGDEIFHFPTNTDALQAPKGLCVDATNNILIADTTKQAVLRYSPEGKFIKEVIKISGTPTDIDLANGKYLVIGTMDKQLFLFDLNA